MTMAMTGLVNACERAADHTRVVARDGKTLGAVLHQSVFDAVMHHVDDVPGAERAGMNIASSREV
jgi:hypothetical protein